jgi:hypothetical protein
MLGVLSWMLASCRAPPFFKKPVRTHARANALLSASGVRTLGLVRTLLTRAPRPRLFVAGAPPGRSTTQCWARRTL